MPWKIKLTSLEILLCIMLYIRDMPVTCLSVNYYQCLYPYYTTGIVLYTTCIVPAYYLLPIYEVITTFTSYSCDVSPTPAVQEINLTADLKLINMYLIIPANYCAPVLYDNYTKQ